MSVNSTDVVKLFPMYVQLYPSVRDLYVIVHAEFFLQSSSLARHRRIHTGSRPYSCPETRCERRSVAEGHMIVNAADGGDSFCRKTTLTKHAEKVHRYDSASQQVFVEGDADDDEDEDEDWSPIAPLGSVVTIPPLPVSAGSIPPGPVSATPVYDRNLWLPSGELNFNRPLTGLERAIGNTNARELEHSVANIKLEEDHQKSQPGGYRASYGHEAPQAAYLGAYSHPQRSVGQVQNLSCMAASYNQLPGTRQYEPIPQVSAVGPTMMSSEPGSQMSASGAPPNISPEPVSQIAVRGPLNISAQSAPPMSVQDSQSISPEPVHQISVGGHQTITTDYYADPGTGDYYPPVQYQQMQVIPSQDPYYQVPIMAIPEPPFQGQFQNLQCVPTEADYQGGYPFNYQDMLDLMHKKLSETDMGLMPNDRIGEWNQ